MANRKWIFPIFLVALVFLGYFSYLSGDFVIDDEPLIVNNPTLNGQQTITSVFTTSLYRVPYTYRPLQILSYIIDKKIYGYNPFGFHLTSLVIHAVNVVLIYYLLSLLLPLGLAQTTSILFAIHPINTSVAGYISGRADLMVVFFMLLSMISVLKFINSKLKAYYIMAILSALLALFCRENSLILFLLIFLVCIINKVGYRRAILLSTPFLLLSLIYSIAYSIFSRHLVTGFFPVEMSPLFIIINFLNIILNYMGILILPLNLHMFRSSEFILSLFDIRALTGILFLILSIYFIHRFRRNRAFLLGAFWFFIGLIPVVFILNRYPWLKRAMMAESWLYLSSSGVFLLFAVVLNRFAKVGKIVFCLYVILCLYLTYEQHIYWKDNIDSYKNIMKYLPERNPVRRSLVKAYLKRNLYDEALVELNKIIRDYPANSESYALEGDYYYAVKNFAKARECYKAALALNWMNHVLRDKLDKIEVENGK